MANSKLLTPFILKWEGGWVNNPHDRGGETNKGITYNTWKSFFGDSHERFMAMAEADWNEVFKRGYWDAVCGDKINSQRIAEQLADMCWGSGKAAAVRLVQRIVGTTQDGRIGEITLGKINAMDEVKLFSAICTERVKFLAHIPIRNASQAVFIDGWLNREMELILKHALRV